MGHLELVIDRDRNGLVLNGLDLKRLTFDGHIALRQAHLHGVANLRAAFRPCAFKLARELGDESNVVVELVGRVRGDPVRRDDEICWHSPFLSGPGESSVSSLNGASGIGVDVPRASLRLQTVTVHAASVAQSALD